jgi:hypothetical protein
MSTLRTIQPHSLTCFRTMLGTTLLWSLLRWERQPLAVNRWADIPSRYAQAVRAVGAHRVSVFCTFDPLLVMLLSVIVGGESVTPIHILAMAVVPSGIFLATRHAAHPSTAFPSGLQSTISAAVKDQWGNLAEDFPAFDLADENRVVTSR